eukprot:1149849-Pelagomonas_calceolata.AAC.3
MQKHDGTLLAARKLHGQELLHLKHRRSKWCPNLRPGRMGEKAWRQRQQPAPPHFLPSRKPGGNSSKGGAPWAGQKSVSCKTISKKIPFLVVGISRDPGSTPLYESWLNGFETDIGVSDNVVIQWLVHKCHNLDSLNNRSAGCSPSSVLQQFTAFRLGIVDENTG